MQINLCYAESEYIFAPVLVILVFSVYCYGLPRQRLGDSFLVYLHSNEMT